MTSDTTSPVASILPDDGQGPLQWIVRTAGVLSFAALIASVPALHVYWHYWCGESQPMVRVNSQVPKPPMSLASFRDGTWMKGMERHLQENSPVSWELRGRYNELRYELGLLQTADVQIAPEGWMFIRGSLRADSKRLAARAAARRRTLESLRRRAEELGVSLFAVPVPDKATVYPEHAWADGQLPADKARLYPLILGDLEAAGIPRLDCRDALAAAKAVPDSPLLYYRSDSHWSGHGALTVARAAAARVSELGLDLGPGDAFEVIGPVRVQVVPDLVALLGLRCRLMPVEIAPGVMRDLVRPVGAAAVALLDYKEYFQLWVKDPAGSDRPNLPYDSAMPSAEVALCGTSFSAERGMWTFAFALGRVLDHRGVILGGGPFKGLQETLGRIETGESSARLIVWEFVERSYLEPEWLHPPVF